MCYIISLHWPKQQNTGEEEQLKDRMDIGLIQGGEYDNVCAHI